jgi:hypothetical protein
MSPEEFNSQISVDRDLAAKQTLNTLLSYAGLCHIRR